MPKIDLTPQEVTLIINALHSENISARRAQKTGKTPAIQEVYKTHERVINELITKVDKAQ